MAEDLINSREKTGVAYRLELTRQALGFEQGEFAARAGIANNTYNQYKQAVNAPTMAMAHRLCDAHGLTLDWIFRGDTSALRRRLADAIDALHKQRAAED
jgi:transcriptional regulator with XRE-family HTH domain